MLTEHGKNLLLTSQKSTRSGSWRNGNGEQAWHIETDLEVV